MQREQNDNGYLETYKINRELYPVCVTGLKGVNAGVRTVMNSKSEPLHGHQSRGQVIPNLAWMGNVAYHS